MPKTSWIGLEQPLLVINLWEAFGIDNDVRLLTGDQANFTVQFKELKIFRVDYLNMLRFEISQKRS